ncbi:hypothetical protein [Neokomagataea anthophila]|uniref:Dynamin family protein n=1 Tax=Neokomagataea anthophila TaxID=2826925 RepID=A0ABS5E931_9PROT|nr:hypothetical protein [Neokomagataea anthophila]MBR0560411.1 hypothetical protein [Neokomagataea anthophila]
MFDVKEKIAHILHNRRSELPEIERQILRWENLKQQLSGLDSSITTLCQQEASGSPPLEALKTLRFSPLYEDISTTLASLNLLKARFSRSTLNIGVSGRARVGKSTLLQSIAGLTDEQIPTGSGLPVTAVRSRIFHSAHKRATLILHSYETFRRDVLQPYHAALDLPEAPQTVEQFSSYQYPRTNSELSEAKQQESTAIPVLRRLKEMQAALPSYREYLTGAEKIVDLEALRQFVAYPTAEAEKQAYQSGQAAARPYLAVRDVQIECPFPYAQVSQLGIVDLPGLGELAANAEEHHLEGLQNDVDLVMLVKRPIEGMAYWGKEDGAATNLLDKARGFIQERRDFVYLVINTGGVDDAKIDALRGDILRNVNDGQENKHFRVLETDTSDEKKVYDTALEPVLIHLAERLPIMDKQVRDGTIALSSSITQRVQQVLTDIETALTAGKSSLMSTSEQEALDEKVELLHRELSYEMRKEVEILKEQARKDFGPDYQDYADSVKKAYERACHWIDDGFGEGAEKWCSDAAMQFSVGRGSAGFCEEKCNHIRVEVRNIFSGINQHFDRALDSLWILLADNLLNKKLGNLLSGYKGRDALVKFGELMATADEPCININKAVNDLLSLRLDYSNHIYPSVRPVLDGLDHMMYDPETQQDVLRFGVYRTEEQTPILLQEMSDLTHKVVSQLRNAMLDKAAITALAVHAAAEQFEDALIRSETSVKEFRRMARCYRDDIWPDHFAGIAAASARVRAVKIAMKAVRETLAA